MHPSVLGDGDPGPAPEMEVVAALDAVEAEILHLPPGDPRRVELEGIEARLKADGLTAPEVRRARAVAEARATARSLGIADNPGRLA